MTKTLEEKRIKQNEYNKTWRLKNKERHLKKTLAWQKKNRTHYLEYLRAYYQKNKKNEKLKKQRRQATKRWLDKLLVIDKDK